MIIHVYEDTLFEAVLAKENLVIFRYLSKGNQEGKSIIDPKEFISVATAFLQKLPIPEFVWVNAVVIETLELIGILMDNGSFRFYDNRDMDGILKGLLVKLNKEN